MAAALEFPMAVAASLPPTALANDGRAADMHTGALAATCDLLFAI
jgi:hypothetical protein